MSTNKVRRHLKTRQDSPSYKTYLNVIELATNWHRFDNLKYSTALPFTFTEHGAVMLAPVLPSQVAVQTSIIIIRAFIRLGEIFATHKELAEKLKELEIKIESHYEQIATIFQALNQLLTPPDKPKRKIGFPVEEKKIKYS